jgi:hypothetical protein
MKLTHAHMEFWLKHQKPPIWVQKLLGKQREGIVHGLINAQMPPPTDGELTADRLIYILKSVRKRHHSILATLERLIENPGCLPHAKKRQAFCIKWAKRLRKAKN